MSLCIMSAIPVCLRHQVSGILGVFWRIPMCALEEEEKKPSTGGKKSLSSPVLTLSEGRSFLLKLNCHKGKALPKVSRAQQRIP